MAGRCPAGSCGSTRPSTARRSASSRRKPASTTSTSSSSTRSVRSAATDAMGVGWFALDDLPNLAFDHDEIVARAHERLRGKVRYAPVGFELLPPRFSLTQLQRLYEIILGTERDKRHFRTKILSMDLLGETDEVEQRVPHRAARLYRFGPRKYERLLKQGFELSI